MLWEHGVAGSNPAIPIFPCDGTGIRAGIRVQILQVQILSGVLSSRGGTEDALDRGSSFLQVRLLSGVPISEYALVAQPEEALRLERRGCWFKSSQGHW